MVKRFYVVGMQEYLQRSFLQVLTVGSAQSAHTRKVMFTTCEGDLSTVEASILVTSAGSDFFQTDKVSATSKALYKQAGPALQAAAKANTTKLKAGDVFSTPGFNLNCKEVYHAVLTSYDPKSGRTILTQAIQTCLSMADYSAYSSIAFPTLGGGGFGYPPSLIMQVFNDVLQNFEPRFLQKVTLVIFPSDQLSIQAARNELSFSMSAQSQSKASAAQQAGSNWKNLSIFVESGDLLTCKCDAIVNSTVQFDLTGQVGKLIVARGGQTIADECAKKPIKSSACYRVTSAGKLPMKYIIHVNTPKDANQLAPVLGEALQVAEELNMRSVGIPALGSGNLGLGAVDLAKSIRKAFDAFDARNPKHLCKIEVWIFQQKMLADFQLHILGGSQPTPATQTVHQKSAPIRKKPFFRYFSEMLNAETSKPVFILPKAGSNVDKPSVSILLCSYQEKNTSAALKCIDEKVKELTLTEKIEDNVLQKLAPSDEFELLAIGRKHKVTIERSATQRIDDITSLVISGLKRNVEEACRDSNSLIRQLENALTCSRYVIWKHKYKKGKTEAFPLRASNELEQAYQKNPKGSLKLEIFVNNGKECFMVDFNKMEETCQKNGTKLKVKRCPLSDKENSLPATWEDMGGLPWKTVPVKQGSTEYMTVMQKFNATAQFNVVKLERVQNPTLYKQFQAQKKKVADRMTQSKSTLPVTIELFHGTSSDVCPNIFKDGFDRSHAGKNATVYGRGVYFAVASQYSTKFAQNDQQGQKRMFLTEVVTGEYCQGNKAMQTVPMQASGSPYDSVVDNVANPSIYVVFKDPSVYPSYMLTFT